MAVTAPVLLAGNKQFSSDFSSTVRLGQVLAAPTAGASEESVACMLRLLRRMSLERDAQAKVEHELLPPAEVSIAPDAGTVVDARQHPPLHEQLSNAVVPGDTAAPTADPAAPIADDADSVMNNATDTAGAGEHVPAAAVKGIREVLAAAAAAKKSSPPTREAMPGVVKNTKGGALAIPLSPDVPADALIMDGEATLAATETLPDAAVPATSPARAAAAATHSPRPPSVRGGPSAAVVTADPASAVAASNAVEEVSVSATAAAAAADGMGALG